MAYTPEFLAALDVELARLRAENAKLRKVIEPFVKAGLNARGVASEVYGDASHEDGRVVTLIADIGAEIADDVADAIRAGGTIHRFPMAHSPRLGDEVPHD